MRKATRTRPDPLAFSAALTIDEFREVKKWGQEFATARNLALVSLTKGGHDMAQIAWTNGDVFMELMEHAMDYQKHLEGELQIIKTAVARMIAVGQELSDHGRPAYVTGDPEPLATT